MSGEPESLVMVYLRRIDGKLDGLKTDLQEPKQRVGLLEGQYASLPRRLDRVEDRLGRMERHLDLVEPAR